MKNLKKLSRQELRSVTGSISCELSCYCAPAGTGLPPLCLPSDSSEQCFNTCKCYRGEPGCIR